jgi:DNA-binding response OmpR family regulator
MPNPHILVIEDDEEARTMYGIMLRSWGYDVSEATTGEEGIRAARRHVPDLILLDIMMPDVDGYEVCKALRSDPRFHQVPIIFLTALNASTDRIKGYTIGGDDFITKSQVDYRELGTRIKAALNRTERFQHPSGDGRKGLVIGMMSLRGGVGVSTLALNLAQYATTASEQQVMLIDLSLPIGSVSLWSGVSGPRHSVRLLSRPASEIDINLIRNFSLENMYGSSFIPGPSTLTDYSGIRIRAVEQMLYALREEGYIVIMDLGRATLPLLWNVPKLCDWVTVVTSGDSTSRSLASATLNSLSQYDVDSSSVLLVYNDYTDEQPTDIAIGLPRTPDVFIPHIKDFNEIEEVTPLAHFWSIIASKSAEREAEME